MNTLALFAKKQYLNLETFRRSGLGVKTPVWFVQEQDRLYVITMAESGKVKRIRRNGRVNIAPCRANGAVTGDWRPAQASLVTEAEMVARVNRSFNRKYGLMKKLFERMRASRGSADAVLEIRIDG